MKPIFLIVIAYYKVRSYVLQLWGEQVTSFGFDVLIASLSFP